MFSFSNVLSAFCWRGGGWRWGWMCGECMTFIVKSVDIKTVSLPFLLTGETISSE